jgi:hypothetical protein
MKIGELFVALGIKADQASLKRFNTGINNLKRDAFLMQAAFVGAVFALDRFVDSSIRGVVSLQNLNNQTGLSIEKLQRLQQAGQLADLTLTPEAISQSVANLQKNITDITKLGKGNFRPFQLLGIDPTTGDAFQVLDQVRERIKGVDDAVATNVIQELGLSPQFINILKLSNKEFKELSQNAFFLNSEQRNLILRSGTAITKLKLQMRALKDQAVAKLAPLLIELTNKFFAWLRDNGKKVVDTIASLARAMTRFVTAVGRAVSILAEFLENTIGVENGIKLVVGALALLSVALLPFKGILLIITSLILVLEDLYVWIKGGDSLFGSLFNTIMNFFGGIKDSLLETFESIKSKITDTFKTGADSVMNFFKMIKAIFDQIGKFFEDTIMKPFKTIEGFFDGRLGDFIKFVSPNPNNAQGNNTSNTNNVNINNNITVEEVVESKEEVQRILDFTFLQLNPSTS